MSLEDIKAVLSGEKRWHIEPLDWRPILPKLPEKIADVVMMDPGYTEEVHRSVKSVHDHNTGGAPRVVYQQIDFEPANPFEITPIALRAAKRWVFSFCALEQIGDYKRAAEQYMQGAYIRGGAYRRCNSAPQLSGDRPGQGCEGFVELSVDTTDWDTEETCSGGIVLLHRMGKKQWNGRGKHAFYEAARDRGKRLHPTQKPEDLMVKIVGHFANPGETVWDLYSGSGTTGVAALRHGCRFIGFETNPAHVATSRARLAAEEKGLTLSDVRAGQTSLLGDGYVL